MKPKRQQDQRRVFSRRAAILGGMQAAFAATLVGRLYYLQVLQSEKYKLLAEQNRVNLRILPPSRGMILDRLGVPLARNVPAYRITLVTEKTHDPRAVLRTLQRLISISDEEIERALAQAGRVRAFSTTSVKSDVSWEEVARMEVNTPDLPGLSIQIDEKREYPYGGATAHVLGYVAAPTAEEAGDDPLLNFPGFHVGKTGLERQYETVLRGIPGVSKVEVNASGRVVRELGREEAKGGSDLKTTLDIRLQQYAVQRLSSQLSAAAVLLDVYTGDILALASTPAYDPEAFYGGIRSSSWQSLVADTYRPLANKAVGGLYAPGSTFKPMTALAALQAGMGPDTAVFCPGFIKLGTSLFHCWKSGGHGRLDMVLGIQNSCDVYFYELARRLGIDPIAAMARRFGLGKPTGLDLPGEKAGLVPDQKWKRSTRGADWQQGETLIAAIGQGFVLATPLQLAVMTARLANGGHAVVPHLASDATRRVAAPERLDLNRDWLQIVGEGMRRVTNDRNGTAYEARIKLPGMEMAGKTGTSQVRRILIAERAGGVFKNEDLPWDRRDHALFIAYAPVQAPRYACAVVVEHGGGGSKVAAPIARDILIECQQRNGDS